MRLMNPETERQAFNMAVIAPDTVATFFAVFKEGKPAGRWDH